MFNSHSAHSGRWVEAPNVYNRTAPIGIFWPGQILPDLAHKAFDELQLPGLVRKGQTLYRSLNIILRINVICVVGIDSQWTKVAIGDFYCQIMIGYVRERRREQPCWCARMSKNDELINKLLLYTSIWYIIYIILFCLIIGRADKLVCSQLRSLSTFRYRCLSDVKSFSCRNVFPYVQIRSYNFAYRTILFYMRLHYGW